MKINSLVFILFVFIFNSCEKDQPIYKINNLNGNKISVFGHAGMGMGFKYPDNTYESIDPCLKIGTDGSEIDIQVTKDSVLLVYHNKYLEEGTLCQGIINDKAWSEIWGCHRISPLSSEIKIWAFTDLLEELSSNGYNIYDFTFTFDCKHYTSSLDYEKFLNQFANSIVKSVDKYLFFENILIESQDTVFLRMLQQKCNKLKLFIYPSDFKSGLEIANQMNLFGITLHTKNISKEQVEEAHNYGRRITLWGINTEKENIDAVNKNPDYIQTDKPIHLLKIFNRFNNSSL